MTFSVRFPCTLHRDQIRRPHSIDSDSVCCVRTNSPQAHPGRRTPILWFLCLLELASCTPCAHVGRCVVLAQPARTSIPAQRRNTSLNTTISFSTDPEGFLLAPHISVSHAPCGSTAMQQLGAAQHAGRRPCTQWSVHMTLNPLPYERNSGTSMPGHTFVH